MVVDNEQSQLPLGQGQQSDGVAADGVGDGRSDSAHAIETNQRILPIPTAARIVQTAAADGRRLSGEWTVSDEQLLVKLSAEGYSASQIAAQLGVTRNAIVGKSWRMGRILKGLSCRSPAPRKPAKHKPRPRPQVNLVIKSKPPEIKTPAGQPVSLVNLKAWHCRWPIGEPMAMLSCGARAEDGKPYCPFHGKQAYQRRVP